MMLEEKASNDFRATLSTGAALFSRPDYKFVAGALSEETLWLLGSRGVDSFDPLEGTSPPNDSRAFESGGYYVMRDGWEEKSNYLLVDCGPHGQSNCGHAHADALAIEVATQEIMFLLILAPIPIRVRRKAATGFEVRRPTVP
jgi:hypothetical protein